MPFKPMQTRSALPLEEMRSKREAALSACDVVAVEFTKAPAARAATGSRCTWQEGGFGLISSLRPLYDQGLGD